MKYFNDVSYNTCVGKVCKSKSSGDFKIVKYNDSANVEIQFLKTGYGIVARFCHIRNGDVKDRYVPSVYGVGIVGTKYPISVNDVQKQEYVLWYSMLKRCYSGAFQKQQPNYIGCEASENFKSYEYFYEWCHEQTGFGNKDWQLDKDLLVKGNKVYSESACVFLPREINSALSVKKSQRGQYLIGVQKNGKRFLASCNIRGKNYSLGTFNTEIEAFNAYKQAKENYLKQLANKWKDQIDIRAYEALMNYKVEIAD